MTTVQGELIARRKLSLLQLAKAARRTFAQACKLDRYSRQQFYEIRWNVPARRDR